MNEVHNYKWVPTICRRDEESCGAKRHISNDSEELPPSEARGQYSYETRGQYILFEEEITWMTVQSLIKYMK